MKIRSITCFYDPRQSNDLKAVTRLAATARQQYQRAGIDVQTIRLATIPFGLLLEEYSESEAVALAKRFEGEARQAGFDYLSLGPALPELYELYAYIPAILRATRIVFVAGSMASAEDGVFLPAVRACGEVISATAQITPEGFANLRFAALACVPPHVPFFPAAYHTEGDPVFALAIEAADDALDAFSSAASLADARRMLLDDLEGKAEKLEQIGRGLEKESGISFAGCDFSLAPNPAAWCSLGAALERLGVSALGRSGSLAAAAFLADTLDRGAWLRTGYNGLMLPVLEDSTLGQRAMEGILTVRDLLQYSAVCGTGLDTVPLPGDASAVDISALLLDLSALAVRLGKPLTARLMPVPGKRAGDMTAFEFDYFANSRVMALPVSGVQGLLAGDETMQIQPRPQPPES